MIFGRVEFLAKLVYRNTFNSVCLFCLFSGGCSSLFFLDFFLVVGFVSRVKEW